MKILGRCEKCSTPWGELFQYNDRWLCNMCYDEEVEHDSGKVERDEAKLEEYRQLVAGTK